MVMTIIFTILGIIFGAAGVGLGGWMSGGAIGFLLAQVMRLSTEVKNLSLVVVTLKEEFQRVTQQSAAQRNVHQSPAQPSQPADNLQGAVKVAKPLPARVPLAERIKSTAAEKAGNPVTTSLSATQASAQLTDTPLEKPLVDAASVRSSRDPSPSASVDGDNSAIPQAASTARAANSPAGSRSPNGADKLFKAIGTFFTEGNPIVRVGMVVMFFGLSFLVKYAASEGLLPVELRLSTVALIALALIIVGWKTRAKEGGYGLVLQGGGIAGLYLTVFASLKLYHILPPALALVLMLVMVLLGAILAIKQNAQVLALMASACGFLAPILTSEGSGSHMALFGFYLLLNIGILTVAWFKTWQMLNWVGFMFTFVIASLWGVLRYEPQFFASTQPFLIAFFALYLLVSILFSLKQPPKLTGLVDGSLVFGLPVVFFGLQSGLMQDSEYGLAISALILSVLYFALAIFLGKKYQQDQRVLKESFVALAVTFATLAIPLALSAEWTSATWALEAAGLIWIGLRQDRWLPRMAGYCLHFAAAASLILPDGLAAGPTPIVSGDFLGMVILSLSALCIAYLFHYFPGRLKDRETMMVLSLAVGWIWWLLAGSLEISEHLPRNDFFVSIIIFFSLSSFIILFLGRKLVWPQITQLGFWLMPLMLVWMFGHCAVAVLDNRDLHPTQGSGILALMIFFAVQYFFLWQIRERKTQNLLSIYHLFTAWLLLGLILWEAHWWSRAFDRDSVSALLIWFFALGVPLLTIIKITNIHVWPFTAHGNEYKNVLPLPLILFLLAWFLRACSNDASIQHQYLPIINPLDLAQLAVIFLLGYASKRKLMDFPQVPVGVHANLIGGALFIWLNVVVLRGVHHFSDVIYSPYHLWNSPVAQMALSILWTLCALSIMYLSRRHQDRHLWMSGAGLLAIVVAKLALKDLSGSSTLAGIVSFTVVGGLMLLIGYLSPMPTKKINAKNPEDQTLDSAPPHPSSSDLNQPHEIKINADKK